MAPPGAAPQTWRAKIGLAEAAEKRTEAARMVAENECILKVVGCWLRKCGFVSAV